MKTGLMLAILAGVVLAAVPAHGGDDEEQAFFERARRLEREKHFEKAIDAYELVIREWGLDGRLAVTCHLRIAECLAMLERVEDGIHVLEVGRKRYGEAPEAREAFDLALESFRERVRGGEEREWGRRLEELERRLKEEGLTGEELGEAYQREKRRMEAERARRHAEEALHRVNDLRREREEKFERMARLWREAGVSREEIEERLGRLREQHGESEAARQAVEALARRLKEEGLPREEIRERVEALERRRREEMEEGWRGRREEERDAVRGEFLHLAERLGIPAHEAERFLEEHARRRHDERPGERHLDDVARKVEALEGFLFKLDEMLGRFAHRLEKLEDRLRLMEERDR